VTFIRSTTDVGQVTTIGILNAVRAGGDFLGPVVATTVLAWHGRRPSMRCWASAG
jgi:hypothetical protein